ncbi:MAG: hypothetical protein L0H96_24335 [Humibacillus sp.]|nr:hypothetical protein [Humibacillus sp.]MDN5780013.1 hypothetical protein [Humibacillus sp.]
MTVLFWVAKLLSTGMGEAGSDFLFARFGAVGLLGGGVVYVVAMVAQLRSALLVSVVLPASTWAKIPRLTEREAQASFRRPAPGACQNWPHRVRLVER